MPIDITRFANKNIQQMQAYQAGKPVEELQREYGIEHVVKLASNENPLGASPKALACLNDVEIRHNLSRYPDSNGFHLKQKLASHFNVTADCLTLGNGSNDILDLIPRVFANHTHSILFSEHAFLVYPMVTQMIGATPLVTPAKNWGHDLTAMLNKIQDNTKIIFIANPNNPTGTWLKNEELYDFICQVPEHILIILDEAYGEYVDIAEYPDSVAWLEKHPNLIITRTFSKAYGLAGLRVGYAISHPQIADCLNRARQPFNVNSLALATAELALEDSEYLQKTITLNQQGMTQISTAFDKMGLNYIPSIGNFLCVDVQQDAFQVYQKLLQQGVIVRPVANYAMPQHLRISIGLIEENQVFIDKLPQCLK